MSFVRSRKHQSAGAKRASIDARKLEEEITQDNETNGKTRRGKMLRGKARGRQRRQAVEKLFNMPAPAPKNERT